jgi:hypothetical protein
MSVFPPIWPLPWSTRHNKFRFRVRGSVIDNNVFWIGLLDLLALPLQFQSITCTTAHNRWLPKTCFIPYWTTSVFSVIDSLLIYESVTSSASVIRWLTLHSCLLNSLTTEWTLEFKSKLCYGRRSVGQSVLEVSTIWGLRPDLYYCQTVVGLLMWDALSDERTGLSFARVWVWVLCYDRRSAGQSVLE